MVIKKRVLIILSVIILLGAFFRLWGLGSAELVFDEGMYGFRSIGYLDYLDSPYQTTPVQWYGPSTDSTSSPQASSGQAGMPWWTHLSFHDHPPLYFLIQHFFFAILGDNLLAARLPSALAGLASIFIIYLIARKLFSGFNFSPAKLLGLPAGRQGMSVSEIGGLSVALLASVRLSLVSVSRVSMQEGVLFFFILLNFYFFLKLQDGKGWVGFGLTLGAAMLVKYIAVFLVPVYLITLFITRSVAFRDRRLYLSLLLAAILFSPVIVYNLELYKNFGHFDLQFFYLLKQKTAHWQPTTWGKNQEPLANLAANLRVVFSWFFMIISLLGLAVSGFLLKRREASRYWWPVFLMPIFITLLLVFTGSAIRFSSLYAIPLIFMAILVFMFLYSRYPQKSLLILSVFMLFTSYEFYFTYQTTFARAPDYGVVKLDQYFDSELGEARLADLPENQNPNLDKIIKTYAAPRPATLQPTGIIYDENIATTPRLWVFGHRRYYHGIPMLASSQFDQMLLDGRTESLKNFNLYFVQAGTAAPRTLLGEIKYSEKLNEFLKTLGLKNPPRVITDADSQPAFWVYNFSL